MIPAPIVYQEQDQLLTLFLFVDMMLTLLPRKKTSGRHGDLSDVELVTLALWRFYLGFHDWKHAYMCFLTHYQHEFPKLPVYKNFVQGINRASVKALFCLGALMYLARKDNRLLKFIDASALPVCKNSRISTHKVMKRFASRDKTHQGWYFGMKLHAVIDTLGNLLSVRITTASVDDRKPVVSMLRGLFGVFVADARYLSQKLKRILFTLEKDLVTGVRNNMNQIMTKGQHTLLRKRQWIEIVFSQIKERLKMATSLPRSVTGMFSHYIYTLLAYQTFKVLNFKASIS